MSHNNHQSRQHALSKQEKIQKTLDSVAAEDQKVHRNHNEQKKH